MTDIKDKALLDIARQLIELKWNVRLTSIEFEDGSGLKYSFAANRSGCL